MDDHQSFKIWPDHKEDNSIMTGSDHFGFLIYVSWKMMGWVLVMAGVLLALRCLRMWLLSAWLRESGLEHLGARMDRNTAILQSLHEEGTLSGGGNLPRSSSSAFATYNETSEARSGSQLSDNPPKYEDVVCQTPQIQLVVGESEGMDKADEDDGCPTANSDPTTDVATAGAALPTNHCQEQPSATEQEEEPPSYSEIFHQQD